LGKREFWSLEFRVTSDVLTPRPETELLVEAGLSKIPDLKSTSTILDLGTGSGAIALCLASERPQAIITATDLSQPALQIAAENADHLQMAERVQFLSGDLFEPVACERFDLIVSNPPYVARADAGSLPPELAHEPEMALFAGGDGLDVIRNLVAQAGDHLSPGGWLFIELSPEQVEIVEQEFAAAGFEKMERRFDLAGRPRVVGARWSGQ
jgi:release factor glutamine methyltransferase